jgi:peptide/nickel transport system permease protein
MRTHRKLLSALLLLIPIHIAVLLAGFVAPYGFGTQDRLHPYARPSRIHFFDCAGKFHLRPLVSVPQDDEAGQNIHGCAPQAPLRFFVHGEGYDLLGFFHTDLHLFGVVAPARVYLLGSDAFGRDQFARLLYGGQVSLFAGLIAAGLAMFIAWMVGAIAGLYGGLADDAAMRLAEATIAVPSFYLLLAVRSFLPLQIGEGAALVLVISVVAMFGWARPARLVRGVVLSGKERNYVLAARGFGASRLYLLRRHLMPMTLNVVLTQMAVLIPQFILAEVILSFLGLGIGEPFPSWGNMLAQAQQYHVLVSYWWMLVPGVALVPVILAYHMLADALQEKLKSDI